MRSEREVYCPDQWKCLDAIFRVALNLHEKLPRVVRTEPAQICEEETLGFILFTLIIIM